MIQKGKTKKGISTTIQHKTRSPYKQEFKMAATLETAMQSAHTQWGRLVSIVKRH